MQGIKVLDLTSRLPGPLATHILSLQGAEVTKLEWSDSPDPFRLGDGESDPIFKVWYDQFNARKKIIHKDFAQFDKKELDQYDLIFYTPKKRYENFFHKDQKLVKVLGGRETKYMHDLNALSLSKSFHLSDGNLPHLPFAGIIYAQNIALKAMSLLHNDKEKHIEVYLSDINHEILDLFWDSKLKDNTKHLHTGKFPCYNIYRSADNKLIAFAAVEERFWLKFSSLFNLNLELTDRFDTSNRVIEIIKSRLSALSYDEIKNIIGDEDICITFLPH